MSSNRELLRSLRHLDEHELRRVVMYAQGLLDAMGGPRFEGAIDRNSRHGVTLRQQKVRCSKAGCATCPHGPYWYAYWRDGAKSRSKYLGRKIPDGFDPSSLRRPARESLSGQEK